MAAEEVFWGWGSSQYVSNMWVKYRLTTKLFEVIWEKQEGKCAGCGMLFAHPLRREVKKGIKCQIDHCHIREVVRGLLCQPCNAFLGKIKDNRMRLQNLDAYLERSENDVNAVSTK